jgi:hypothetical protein
MKQEDERLGVPPVREYLEMLWTPAQAVRLQDVGRYDGTEDGRLSLTA